MAPSASSACGFGGGGGVLGVGAGIGRLEVDDVAQQDLALGQLVAPDDDGLEGEGAFAEAGDHRLAAGLDALGDGDLALAGQKLDRAHLAQIHAHRIVGAVGRLLGGVLATAVEAVEVSASSPAFGVVVALASSASSASSVSMTLMPISESIA